MGCSPYSIFRVPKLQCPQKIMMKIEMKAKTPAPGAKGNLTSLPLREAENKLDPVPEINRNLKDQPNIMKASQTLHDLGQSLWLDNITRDLLNSGTLKRYLGELSVTGLPQTQPSLITPSKVSPTILPSARAWKRGNPARDSFSISHWTI